MAESSGRAVEPEGGLAYHDLQRLGAPGAWRPAVGVVALFLVVAAVAPILVFGLLGADATAKTVTPSYLAANDLIWALAIPSVLVVAWVVNRLPRQWLYSVVACFRWRWFAACLGVAVVTLAVTSWVSAVLPSQGEATVTMSGHLNPWTDQLRDFVLIVVLLQPLQAAGEEFVFRGYLTQAVGGLSKAWGERLRAVVVVVVPALLFGLAHGIGQDVPVFFDRFAFGLVAGTLVLVTGGLEAGIAMHVLNNLASLGLALAYGDISETLKVTHGSWWAIPVTLTQSLLYLGLCWALSRRVGLKSRSGEGVLEGPSAAV